MSPAFMRTPHDAQPETVAYCEVIKLHVAGNNVRVVVQGAQPPSPPPPSGELLQHELLDVLAGIAIIDDDIAMMP